MSLLGFDSLGRLALGQLSRIGLTNTVLNASGAAYATMGRVAVFKAIEPAGAAAFAITSSGSALRTAFAASPGVTYLVTGNAIAFVPRLSAGAGGHSVGASAATYAARMLSSAAAVSIAGQFVGLEPSMRSLLGSHDVVGFDAGYSRGFEDWFPRPFDTDGWSASNTELESWMPKASQPEQWSDPTPEPQSWVAAVKQPEKWITE
jgi:hypothetical protein